MTINTVGVVGAGIMGSGIAQIFAASGYPIRLHDVDRAALDRGLASVSGSLDRFIARGKLMDTDKSAILERITTDTRPECLADADLVVEAASENSELKHRIFGELSRVCAPTAILASNTSSISLTRIAAAARCPERVVGMHFSNPVPLMALVEIIEARQTNPDVTRLVTEVVRSLGKTPVTVRDSYGFVTNRVLLPMINEAVFVLHEGVATATDIDQVLKLGMNHPMGPLALADMIGLDTCLSIMEVLYEGFNDPKYRPCPLLKQMVDAGHLGRKSGRGFYNYGSSEV